MCFVNNLFCLLSVWGNSEVNMTIEQARATLVLLYGIDKPTDKQIAHFLFFNEVVK